MKRRIFIFGSNLEGFHGTGTAGWAFRGDARNNWQTCPMVRAAMEAGTGYPGLLAQWGIGEGLQTGTQGYSWALPTVSKPGRQRSISLNAIDLFAEYLTRHMRRNPNDTFCLSPLGCGYAGYTLPEMRPIWNRILAEPNARWATTTPQNIIELTKIQDEPT